MRATGEAMDRNEQALHAYHDGELGWLARRRFERRLARSPELRRELDALSRLGELARRVDTGAPAPDLWSGVAAGLRRQDPARPQATGAGPFGGLLGPALATAAAAVLVIAVVLGLRDTGAPPPTLALEEGLGESLGVVRWIDPGRHSVLVLEGESDATIIWVLEGGREVSRGEGRDVV